MQEPIVTLNLLAQIPGGDQFPITLAIGRPYQIRSNPDVWACAVTVDPLTPDLNDRMGGDALRALDMACYLALDVLCSFRADGGRILSPDGSNYPIEALDSILNRANLMDRI